MSESPGSDQGQVTPSTRAGFVALVGRPNVGKSTLLNALLGTKLAIVSGRPQTTRNRILGVQTRGAVQTVLLDTPGIHRTRDHGQLNRFMVQEALDAVEGVDCVVLVTEINARLLAEAARDATPTVELHPDDRFVLEQLGTQRDAGQGPGRPDLVVAINKIDLVQDRRHLLPLMAAWVEAGFDRLLPMSALRDDGVDRLLDEVEPLLPEGPHLFPEEMFTDRAERFLAAELIREQVFQKCRQELPYATAIEVREFVERGSRGDVCIDAVIHVEREGQKAIVIGKRGSMIKEVGTAARMEIGRLLGCEVHLKLAVHVEADWTRSAAARRRFGYE